MWWRTTRAVVEIANVLADQRRQANDEVASVSIAHERNAPERRKRVLALGSAFANDRVEPPREGTERIRVLVVASHLAANGEHVTRAPRRGLRAGLEDEALHRVEVDLKARRPGGGCVVQAARTDDGHAHRHEAEPALLEANEVRANLPEELVRGLEGFPCACPALLGVIAVRGARLPKPGLGLERQPKHEIARRRGVGADRPSEDAGPRLTQGTLLVRDKLLGVIDARGKRASRPAECHFGGAFTLRVDRDGGDDERPEPRPQPIFVDTDYEHSIRLPQGPRK